MRAAGRLSADDLELTFRTVKCEMITATGSVVAEVGSYLAAVHKRIPSSSLFSVLRLNTVETHSNEQSTRSFLITYSTQKLTFTFWQSLPCIQTVLFAFSSVAKSKGSKVI